MPDRPVRIVYLNNSLGTGGTERQIVYMACAQRARGMDVQVFTLISGFVDPNYHQHLKDAGIPLVTLGATPGKPDLLVILRVFAGIRRADADIVHSFLFQSNILARVSRLINPRPRIVSSIRSTVEKSRFREVAYRLTDPLSDVTTQNSQQGAERYIQNRVVPAHKMRVVLNGVDTGHFRPCPEARQEVRRELALEDGMAWLSVGRMDPVKNYPLLLRAFQRVRAEHPQTVLWIAGDGALRAALEQQAADLGIESCVRFLGRRQDIERVFSAADAFVMASQWEGTANVLLEAAASALPIVATDVGGTAEAVVDGVTGLLVQPEDVDDLYRKMAALMAMPEAERRAMGARGRAHIEAHYSLEASMNHWTALYQEILGGHVPR